MTKKKMKTHKKMTKLMKIKTFSYLKLTFIGTYSKVCLNQIIHMEVNIYWNLFKVCLNQIIHMEVNIVFTSKKVSSFFSTKDKFPRALRSLRRIQIYMCLLSSTMWVKPHGIVTSEWMRICISKRSHQVFSSI